MTHNNLTDLFPYKKIVAAFVQQELASLELGQSEARRQLTDFADLAFELYLFLSEHFRFKGNPFINGRTMFALAREIVYFGYIATHMAIHHTFKGILQKDITNIRFAFTEDKPALLTDNPTQEDLQVWTDRLYQANDLDLKRREALREATINQVGFPFLDRIIDFGRMYERCESHLEQAFLIGIFTLRDSWPRLLNPSFFTNQYQVGDYKLDFVFFGENGQKIIVELDGYPDNEITEDQAVHTKTRSRTLQNAGWKVLRFHRKEIETDFNRCIQQTMHTVKGLPIAGAMQL